MSRYTLNKYESLKSRKIIATVFEKGQDIYKYPLKIYYLPLHEQRTSYPAHVAFSAPKKKFGRAVDRNLIKRRMREAYRLNKHLIYTPLAEKKACYALMVVYVGKEICTFKKIQNTMITLLTELRDTQFLNIGE